MKRTIIFVVVFLLLAALVGGFAYFQFVLKPKMVQEAIFSRPQPLTTVSVEAAQVEKWRPGLPAIGTFEAVQGIDLAAEVGGIVTSIQFESGQEVEQGTLLVQLNTDVEEAELKSAEAQLKQSEADLVRQRGLAQRGNAPQSSLDAAIAERDSNAAEVERIRAVIAQKLVLAPFTGRLGIRKVDLGQYISAGEALVTLTQLDPLFLDFPMPEQQIDSLSVGQDVAVEVDAFPGESFAGKLDSIDARVDQDTRNILVRAQLPNSDGRLLPGMFANVTVLDNETREVVTVPRTAISYSLYGDSIYVVKEPQAGEQQGGGQQSGQQQQAGEQQDGQQEEAVELERRFVRTGETREDRVAILEGVKAGERVVTAGQNKLYPGQKVKITEEPALQRPAERPKL